MGPIGWIFVGLVLAALYAQREIVIGMIRSDPSRAVVILLALVGLPALAIWLGV